LKRFSVIEVGECNLGLKEVMLAAFGNVTKWCVDSSMPIDYVTEEGYVQTLLPMKEDINADGVVNILDIVVAATAYASRHGDPNWNPYADLNDDGVIDILDLVTITVAYGQTGPCP